MIYGFGRMNFTKLIFVPLLLVPWTGCKKTPPPQLPDENKIKIEFVSSNSVPESFKKIVTEAVTKYDKRYTLGFPTLSIVNDTNVVAEKLSTGATDVTLAVSGPRKISINFTTEFRAELPDTLIHELFHTMKPEERR